MSIMLLDIATIPDFELGTRLYNLHNLSEKDIFRVMSTKSREMDDKTEGLALHMQRVLAISVFFQDKESIKIWSVGDSESNEVDLLKILERYADEYKPAVVTWCGDRSIFPVLNFRYLSHCIRSALFASHTNLMSELTGASNNEPVSLHEVAVLAGSPGNKKMTDEDTMNHYLEGRVELIRNNLELSNINTWLIYLRWQLVNGKIDQAGFEAEKKLLIKTLIQEDRTHLKNFVDALM
ncbi:putative 3'-5' exonuclease related to the exonuclease domain of PolB [bacterium BMS3Bbin11]|nr:putative 3'-5' exonuclease related to the exonuclease domain of PolB [bacterium BMS3Abin11]GBE46311.1 putative 3'-5' exonuclease related to the exonuclease domain of PolB [bacterium BMS3Bbin11]HDH09017.1 hypothetical protein [Gammaproteobacteria bacterium]HDH17275.1 hypothetical protein [Gammaproteobacteria bacterium]